MGTALVVGPLPELVLGAVASDKPACYTPS